jgi:hypothetical protein
MDPTMYVNQRVDIILVCRHAHTGDDSAVPYKMKYQNREVVFTRFGLRHPTLKGKRMVHVFDVSDDVNDYRLEFDAESLSWMLIAIIPGEGSSYATTSTS